MANKPNLAKHTIRSCNNVKEKVKSMYTMIDTNGSPGIVDVWMAEEVRDEACKAIGQIELMELALEKDSKKRSRYQKEYRDIDRIKNEAKNNCNLKNNNR